jgi:Flp pilus assembly protein TadB
MVVLKIIAVAGTLIWCGVIIAMILCSYLRSRRLEKQIEQLENALFGLGDDTHEDEDDGDGGDQ